MVALEKSGQVKKGRAARKDPKDRKDRKNRKGRKDPKKDRKKLNLIVGAKGRRGRSVVFRGNDLYRRAETWVRSIAENRNLVVTIE